MLFDVAARTMLGMHEWLEGVALLERAHKLNPLSDSSYGVLKALDLFRNGQDNQTVLSALNLGLGTLWPPFQVMKWALRRRVGDQIGADRSRRSLQAIGFARGDAYFGLIDRERLIPAGQGHDTANVSCELGPLTHGRGSWRQRREALAKSAHGDSASRFINSSVDAKQ